MVLVVLLNDSCGADCDQILNAAIHVGISDMIPENPLHISNAGSSSAPYLRGIISQRVGVLFAKQVYIRGSIYCNFVRSGESVPV